MSETELAIEITRLRALKENTVLELKAAVFAQEVCRELKTLNEISPAKLEALRKVHIMSPSGILSKEKISS